MRSGAIDTIARIAAWAAAGVAVLGLGVFLFAWSGLYNVAASRGHWAIVEWFLAFGMRNSVSLRAMAVSPPPLGSRDLITLGAGHFHSGCAFCHGAPGVPVSPIAEQMLPSPPHLATEMRAWSDAELFWIVRHGLKYTGMPSWVALEREDEVWAVVAFLREMPKLDREGYRALALGDVRETAQSGEKLATVESNPESAGACARCHGAEGSAPSSALVPVLHGQPAEFLVRALQAYAEGARRSGIMQPLASDLAARDMHRLAQYYAELAPPGREISKVEPAMLERGRRLATEGDPDNGIPPCNACHGGSALPAYPRLAGQNAPYMAGQLQLWRSGYRASTDTAAVMAPIAKRLSERDVEAVTAYFASIAPQAAAEQRP